MEAIFGCFPPPPPFFFLKPPQICNAASFISKPLSPPPQILLPLLVPLLQGGTPFLPVCNSLPHGISWLPAQRELDCPLHAWWLSAAPNAGLLPGQQLLLVGVWQFLSGAACGMREHKPSLTQHVSDISEQAGPGGDTPGTCTRSQLSHTAAPQDPASGNQTGLLQQEGEEGFL